MTAPYDGGPHVLLVLGVRSTAADGVWYRVLLTSRPNTASGWVPAEAVQVTRTPYRVVVRPGARTLQLSSRGTGRRRLDRRHRHAGRPDADGPLRRERDRAAGQAQRVLRHLHHHPDRALA